MSPAKDVDHLLKALGITSRSRSLAPVIEYEHPHGHLSALKEPEGAAVLILVLSRVHIGASKTDMEVPVRIACQCQKCGIKSYKNGGTFSRKYRMNRF